VSEFEVAVPSEQPTVTTQPAGSEAADARSFRFRFRVRATPIVLACYLAAALWQTWRLWVHPSALVQSSPGGDPDHFAWFIRYAATAVTQGHLPALVTTAENVPRGINLMWNTSLLLPGVLLSPVTVLAGPYASLTVLVTVGFAGSAASLFWVLRRYGASVWAAALGGAVYGFSPALIHTGFAHYQLQFAVLPPLIADAALRLCLRAGRPVVVGAYLGVLVAAQLFIGEEVLAQAALATALVVAVVALSRPRAVLPAVRPFAIGAAIAAVVFLALAGWALKTQLHGPLHQSGSAFGTVVYGNDLASFITPDPWELLHTTTSAALAANDANNGAEYVAYLGIPMLAAVLAIGIVGWRRLSVRVGFVTGVVLLVLSLGAHLLVSGTGAGLTPTGATWPWGWFANLPLFSPLLPSRLPVVADGAIAAVFAFGLDMTWTWLRRVGASRSWTAAIVGSGALVAVLPLVPVPYAAYPVGSLPAGWGQTLAALQLPAGAPVLVVPVPTAGLDAAMRWQAEGGQAISLIGGAFEGPNATGHAAVLGVGPTQLACYLDYLWDGPVQWSTSPPCSALPPAAPKPKAIGPILLWWRPQAVVADVAGKPVLEQYLVHMFGRPTVEYGSMAGWRLR
jgi:hypothetical protein